MSFLTITMDSEVFRRACIRALAEDTTVEAVLCDHLAAYADGCPSLRRAAGDAARERAEAIQRLIRLSRIPRPVATPPRTTRDDCGTRNWKRDDLYER